MIIHSYDIYDTCFVRAYASPTDLFYDLADSALPRICNFGYGRNTVVEFVKLRIRSERMARMSASGKRDDITLRDIYARFSEIAPWTVNIAELMDAEMALEKQCIQPIIEMLEKVKNSRIDGHKILFLSDMYLPTKFIEECLTEHGFFEIGDEVYVSGDVGLSKSSGRLFSHVLQLKNILPEKLLHTGDNEHSDVRAPSKLGIQTEPFYKSRLTRHEKNASHFVKNGMNSKLLGCGRLLRLSRSNIGSPDFATLTTSIITPTLVAYVAWLIEDAKLRGITRLYFVSRDGQIFYKLAQRLVAEWGGPECRYLYGSREAWLLASVYKMERQQFNWLLEGITLKSIRYVLDQVQLSPEKVLPVLSKYGFVNRLDKLLSNRDIESLWKFLSDPAIAPLVLENAKNKRKLAMAYFEQEGMLSHSSQFALVDVGWRLKTLKALQEILDGEDDTKKVFGYYLWVISSAIDADQSNRYSAFFADEKWRSGDIPRDLFYASTIALIEGTFTMAEHPRVISYRQEQGQINPVFASKATTNSASTVQATHDLIVNQLEYYLNIGFTPKQIHFLASTTTSSLISLLKYPSKQEALSVRQFMTHTDQAHATARPLTAPLGWREVSCIFFNQFGWLPRYELFGPYWLEGSAKLSKPPVRLAIKLLLALRTLATRFRN